MTTGADKLTMADTQHTRELRLVDSIVTNCWRRSASSTGRHLADVKSSVQALEREWRRLVSVAREYERRLLRIVRAVFFL